MKKVLLWLWQLPQNLLGLLVILFTGAHKTAECYRTTKRFGASLGEYVILGDVYANATTIKHEQGHQKQSKYLGPLYLILIGLPSASGNVWDRLFHKKWPVSKRISWYYSLPWEAWADKLGGVKR